MQPLPQHPAVPFGELQILGELVDRVCISVAEHGLKQTPDGAEPEQVQITAGGGNPAHVEVDFAGTGSCLRRRGARRCRRVRPGLHHVHDVIQRGSAQQIGNRHLTTELGLDAPPQLQCVQRVQTQRHQRHGGIQPLDVVCPDHIGQQLKQDLFDG